VSARATLRAATADDHKRVDALFSAFDLASVQGYGAFLEAQADAHLAVEAALDEAGLDRLIPDWQERRRGHLLLQDLTDLGVLLPCSCGSRSPEGGTAGLLLPQEHNDDIRNAALLGALYVLEGSRLGGAVLKRCIPAALPTRFLSAPQPPGAWRKLLETLDAFLYEPDLVDAAVGAARQVFKSFERGGRRVLESV
jgi:heme oxygenase